ncbi:hypothetical protein TRVL_00162 [Trypanosoma vivax]|uniref:Uncharacterized protein n=1 Tax=Trypanosoma vivax (strain Y486) TaxID=1055687 RepID=G0TU34_TRYVY|nr:hypothetical protein TRVL_00162 [Trypanosoma vivax]CCC47468.1 hypothetical protein TVY486_0401340 [Trypanosoma vivax Y486]
MKGKKSGSLGEGLQCVAEWLSLKPSVLTGSVNCVSDGNFSPIVYKCIPNYLCGKKPMWTLRVEKRGGGWGSESKATRKLWPREGSGKEESSLVCGHSALPYYKVELVIGVGKHPEGHPHSAINKGPLRHITCLFLALACAHLGGHFVLAVLAYCLKAYTIEE